MSIAPESALGTVFLTEYVAIDGGSSGSALTFVLISQAYQELV
jgi:hypothetical protein